MVNLIFSVLLLLGIIIYKYVYPKRNINLLFLLVLISLLPLVSILRKGTYESGDLTIHTGFAMSFYESLKDGNIIPRWSSQIIYGYGYPLFLFAYPLPYYLASLFHFIGFNFINSLKLILALSFIASGIMMYLFIKEELKNRCSAFIAAIIYLFSPYHLVDLHFRAAIGEIIAFAILPFCFLTIRKMSNKITFLWFFLSSLSVTLLVLSHQAISLISFPFIIAYCLYLWITKNRKKIKYIFFYILSLIMGLLLSSFYWMPVIFEAKYTNLLTTGAVSFISLSQLFYSPWRWGFLFQGPNGELSFIVGYIQWFIIIFSIILFFKGKISLKGKVVYLISVTSLFLFLIMTQSFSRTMWMNVSLLKGFQYSYRLLLLISFFVSIIAGVVIKNITQKWLFVSLCLIAILTTIPNWGNRKTLPLLTDSSILYELPSNITKVGQGTTIWVNSNNFKSNQRTVPHIEIVQGKADISEISRNSVKHSYLINVTSKNALIKENTLYFPNWIVRVNGNPYPFSFIDTAYPGIITFNLNKGSYKVDVSFMNTKVRAFSMFLSFFSFLALILIFLIISSKRIKNIFRNLI